jgi:hypothetical protein
MRTEEHLAGVSWLEADQAAGSLVTVAMSVRELVARNRVNGAQVSRVACRTVSAGPGLEIN